MKVKEESEKTGLKLNIQKTKIMTFSPITSWQIDGETMETVRDFIFGGFKITPDGEGSHEIKRWLLLGRKVMTNLDSILKSRDISLPTEVLLAKAMVFLVHAWMWELDSEESWAAKNWCFWTVELEKTLEKLWDCKEILKESILKEISPGCSLEGLMLKLKLQYFGHLIEELTRWKRPWCWERLRAGGEGFDRGWDGCMASLTQWTWVCVNSGSWWWIGKPGVLQSIGSQSVRHNWVTELNWTYWKVLICTY